MVHLLNPRYTAYLKTTKAPTNWGFMSFISKMKRLYTGECSVYGRSIVNQDEFTEFINKEVLK